MNKIIFAMFILFLVSCQRKDSAAHKYNITSPHSETNAVYYWKTVCSLDSADYKFLEDNKVERAYIRFFDVVLDESPLAVEEIIPNASLQIKDSIPVKDIVPAIFVTQEALKRMDGKYELWANKIVKRVLAMCSYNELPEPKEIQLDCDWTKSSQVNFFELCKKVKEIMFKQDSTALVSATIRLHQLSQKIPPVDYGVLMLYNTGSFKNISENNSIISKENIEPYLKYLPSYPLHLDIAYPTYSWILLFRNNKFIRLIKEDLPINNVNFYMTDNSHFKVVNDIQIGDLNLIKEILYVLSHQTITQLRR